MRKNSSSRPEQVLLYGFSGTILHTLEYFFNVRMAPNYKLVNDVNYADWVIFNADQPEPKGVLHKLYESKLNKPAIVISIKPLMWNNTVTLLKPFSSQTLEAAIKDVKQILLNSDLAPSSLTQPGTRLADEPVGETESQSSEMNSSSVQTADIDTSGNKIPEKNSKVASLILAAQKRKARLEAEIETNNSTTGGAVASPSITDKSAEKPTNANDSNSPSIGDSRILPDPRVGSVRAQVVARLANAETQGNSKPVGDISIANSNDDPALENQPGSDALSDTPASYDENDDFGDSDVQDQIPTLDIQANEKATEEQQNKPSKVKKATLTPEEKAKLLEKKEMLLKKLEASKAAIALAKKSQSENVVLDAEAAPNQLSLDDEPDSKSDAMMGSDNDTEALSDSKAKPVKDANSMALATQTLFGHLPNLDWADAANKRRMSLSLDGMLLPWLQKAIDQGKSTQKACKVSGIFVHLEYVPWTDCFICDGDDDLLNAMMSSRFALGELGIEEGTTTEADLLDGIGTNCRTISSEDLLWLAGLWTSHGRVLPDDDPTRTRKLRYLPECSAEFHIPELHSILNIWHLRPMSAFQVINELNIPQRYVFGVMAACTTAGLFDF